MNKTVAWCIAIACSSLLLWGLLRQQNLSEIAAAMRAAHWSWMWLATASFLVAITIRGWRIYYLAEQPWRPVIATRLAALHQFFAVMVPFRLGEFSMLPIARKLAGFSLTKSAPILFLSRLCDLICLLLIGVVGFLAVGSGSQGDWLWLSLLLLPLALLLLLGFRSLMGLLQRTTARLASRSRSERIRRLAGLITESAAWVEGHQLSYRKLLAVSMVSWLLSLACFTSVTLIYTQEFSLAQILLFFAGVNVIGVLAFFTVAGIGVAESGLALMIMSQGFPLEQAILLALLIRLSVVGLLALGVLMIELVAGFLPAAREPA